MITDPLSLDQPEPLLEQLQAIAEQPGTINPVQIVQWGIRKQTRPCPSRHDPRAEAVGGKPTTWSELSKTDVDREMLQIAENAITSLGQRLDPETFREKCNKLLRRKHADIAAMARETLRLIARGV